MVANASRPRFAACVYALAGFAALALCMTASPAARAQSAETMARVQKLHQDAKAAADRGDYAACVQTFQKAQQLVPFAVIHYNIGKCRERDGKYVQAIEAYRAYLNAYRVQNKQPAPDQPVVERLIRELESKLKIEVRVRSDPDGAGVYLGEDDRLVGQTPHTLLLSPGRYRLVVKREGYRTVDQQIEVRDQALDLMFPLKLEERTGLVRFDVNVRAARIYVDGKNIGLSPYREALALQEGRHQLVVEKDRYTSATRFFELKAGEDRTEHVVLYLDSPPTSWRAYTGYPFLALGAGGIGLGLFMKSQAEQEFRGTSAFDDKVLLQNLGYIGGGVLLATGTALLIWEYTRAAVNPDDLIDAEAK